MELIEERRKILFNTPHIQTSTSNNFSTDIVAPLKALEIDFEPIQSGSGTPAPDNIRTIDGRQQVSVRHFGKNLFNYEQCNFISGIRNSSGVYQSDSYSGYTVNPTPVIPSTDYTLSGSKLYYTGIVVRVYYLDENGNWISRTSGTQGNIVQFTTPSNCYFIQIQTRFNGTDPSTWQLEASSTATTYEPYTGHEYAVKFPALGKNFYNPDTTEVGFIGQNGAKTVDSNFRYTASIPVNVGETYTFSATHMYSGTAVKRIHGYDINNTWVQQLANTSARGDYSLTFTIPNGISYIKVSAPLNDENKQLEYGSTVTAYEPYTNTVYGGTVDLVKGTLTVDRELVTVNAITTVSGNPKYVKSDATNGYVTVSKIYPLVGSSSQPSDLKADKLHFLSRGIWSAVGFPNCCTINSNQIHINVANDLLGITDYTQETTATAKEKLNAWLAENPVTLTIPVRPTTYQLTPVQIKALYGTNTFYTDDGKIVKVNYWKHMK